jgi:hypothetical protein
VLWCKGKVRANRKTKASPQIPIDLAETTKKPLEELADVQTELFERNQEANKLWLDRVKAETSLASELVSKLSSARSIPDAMTAQVLSTRRFDMIAEDARRVLDYTQKFMQMDAQMPASGFGSKSVGKGQ